jgi:hypothetical protein
VWRFIAAFVLLGVALGIALVERIGNAEPDESIESIESIESAQTSKARGNGRGDLARTRRFLGSYPACTWRELYGAASVGEIRSDAGEVAATRSCAVRGAHRGSPSVYIGTHDTLLPNGAVDTMQYIREQNDD